MSAGGLAQPHPSECTIHIAMKPFDQRGVTRVMGGSEALCVGVLIVEDELLIRMDTASVIEDAGFAVYEASSADEAIHILEKHQDIRFIFTDVHMPGSMDGLKLAHYVRGRWPPIKIIVTSGRVKVREEDLPSGGVFFDKPYRAEQITSKLQEMVGQAA
jgi:CheY-like chemotaxis protein